MKQEKKLSKIYNSKFFWMAVSLIVSIVIWSYVTSIQSVEVTRTFKGVEVQFSGTEQILEENGLTIANVDTKEVTIEVRGPRSSIGSLSSADIKAVIDVSRITQANDMTWTYDLVFPSSVSDNDVTILSRTPDKINFTVIKNISKTLEVRGSFDGHVVDGCTAADKLVFSPENVVVTGPEEVLRNIEYAWVSFGQDKEIDSTYTVDTGFVLKNSAGETISSDGLEFSTNKITVTQPILKTKEVPLKVNLKDGGGLTAADCTVSLYPATVQIEADTRVIDTIDSIVVAEYDLAALASGFENTVTITPPEGVSILNDVTEAKVGVTLPRTYEMTYTVSNITCTNVTSGYNAEVIDSTVTVTLRSAHAGVLDSISADDITITVDLSDNNKTTGNIEKKASVSVSGAEGVGVVGDITVRINISKVNS